MKKKIIIIAIALFLISSVYFSVAIVEKSSAFPNITIKFSKISPGAITLVNRSSLTVNLTKDGINYPLVFVNAPEIGDAFSLTTTEPLLNGNYILTVFASDIVGNKINTTQNITMDVDYMDIKIENPPLSVSPRPVFDLAIRSAEPSFGCKYASSNITTYNQSLYTFSDTTALVHTKENFNNVSADTSFYLPSDGNEKPIYVFCIDNATRRINPEALNISYDTTAPCISAVSVPQLVVEKDVHGLVLSTIIVNSNDKVVCRYSDIALNGTPSQANFSEMAGYFGNLDDENNESKYVKNPSTVIDLTGYVPDVSKIYTFRLNVACINRATFDLNSYGPERVSGAVPVTIAVNLLSPVIITKVSPPDYLTNGTLLLNFTTSKLATCTYEFNQTAGTLGTADNKIHTKLVTGDFPEGKYDLKINCIAEPISKTETYAITIDKTPPSTPAIVSPNATCTNSLSAAFSAQDNESGISGYNYSIVGPGVNVTNKFTSSSSATESSLNLTNYSTYYFTAKAVNKAGLSSASGQGNSIRYDETGVLCDDKPPSVFIRQNTTATGVFVSLICIDRETSCNNNTYNYFVSGDQNCTEGAFQQIAYDTEMQAFGALVSTTGYFCYEASDVAGNKATGAERIIFASASSCYNNIQDGGETDIDCGGDSTCVRCDISKICSADSDCISRYCKDGICQLSSCEDLIRNGFETGIDCGGGICKDCTIGQECVLNSDCDSNYCNQLTGKCDVPSCSDNITNGNETDTDCGGGACDRCGLGKYCLLDSDCVSSSCFGGKCVQQPIPPNETKPYVPPEAGNILFKILKIVFLMIGILGIFGGGGYLYYKKHLPKKPSAATTAKPTVAEARQIAKPKELTAEEKIRKLTVQEQIRREKEEKEKKRESLFGVFGAPGKIAKAPPEQPRIKEEIKPIAKKPLIPIFARKPEARIEKKEEDIFGRLSRLKGETEFEKLEKFGKGKKAEDIEKLRRKKK